MLTYILDPKLERDRNSAEQFARRSSNRTERSESSPSTRTLTQDLFAYGMLSILAAPRSLVSYSKYSLLTPCTERPNDIQSGQRAMVLYFSTRFVHKHTAKRAFCSTVRSGPPAPW